MPSAGQLRPLVILQTIWNHLRLRRPRGEAARHYNVLQKLAYSVAVFVLLLPVMVLSGLTMSPGRHVLMPFLFDLFGGRQLARTIHFRGRELLVLFVHVVMVLFAGFLTDVRPY